MNFRQMARLDVKHNGAEPGYYPFDTLAGRE